MKKKSKKEQNHNLLTEYFKQQNEQHKANLGLLGKLFGSRSNAPTNIIGLMMLILILVGLACNRWNSVLPILTTFIGYMYGVNSTQEKRK